MTPKTTLYNPKEKVERNKDELKKDMERMQVTYKRRFGNKDGLEALKQVMEENQQEIDYLTKKLTGEKLTN